MHHTAFPLLLSALALLSPTMALGINCRGSGLCPLASFNNPDAESVMEVLRRVVLASPLDNSTTYNSGDHITCVAQSQQVNTNVGVSDDGADAGLSFGGNVHEGGICLFPQGLQAPLTLGSTKDLVDALIQHGCTTCGSVPVHEVDQGNNDPGEGILTFNFVGDPSCIGNCIDPEA